MAIWLPLTQQLAASDLKSLLQASLAYRKCTGHQKPLPAYSAPMPKKTFFLSRR